MIQEFFESQLSVWPLAADNFAALKRVETKSLSHGLKVQFNPARIVSTGAKMDAATIKMRPCFLCSQNRPVQQKVKVWGDYELLVNPFPIFPRHFTLPLHSHEPQRIYGRVGDMARLAQKMYGYTLFYNGPRCGASAPDHMHFQAGNSDFLPIWSAIPAVEDDSITAAEVFGGMGVIIISATTPERMTELFNKVYAALPMADEEPMLNLLMRADQRGAATFLSPNNLTKSDYDDAKRFTAVVIPRKRHRPTFYGDGEGQMILSPASVDLGGVLITPRREDFDKIDDEIVAKTFSELCMDANEVGAICDKCSKKDTIEVSVGILSDDKLEFRLHGNYLLDGDVITGLVSLSARSFKDTLIFTPVDPDAYVEVEGVTIGINFHWERRETQCFKGSVKIARDGDQLVFINVLDIEDYLTSVISSEMSATSSLELLKAHAVISRSWVLAQIWGKKDKKHTVSVIEKPDVLVKWYDHDDHDLFDVCADDHCQRYQGITRQTTPTVVEAVKATAGQVIMYGHELCDARFSKCCGGMMEEFEYCWGDEHKGYLVGIRDDADEEKKPDLRNEENARKWILSSPDAYCNTDDVRVLRQVLNGYDQETADFYRWTVHYDTKTLSDLVARRTGLEFGTIIDLIPLERGTSGRISLLKIVGTALTKTIGKELEIRRSLSESHLYSSAFVVEKTEDGFTLHGAGWGHGVGLCQIGAAVMADHGIGYRDILSHYYPGSELRSVHTQEPV